MTGCSKIQRSDRLDLMQVLNSRVQRFSQGFEDILSAVILTFYIPITSRERSELITLRARMCVSVNRK